MRKVGNNTLFDVFCLNYRKKIGVGVNSDTASAVVCCECEKWICARCGTPIRKGTFCVERKDKLVSHFGCSMSVLSNAMEDEPVGFGE